MALSTIALIASASPLGLGVWLRRRKGAAACTPAVTGTLLTPRRDRNPRGVSLRRRHGPIMEIYVSIGSIVHEVAINLL